MRKEGTVSVQNIESRPVEGIYIGSGITAGPYHAMGGISPGLVEYQEAKAEVEAKGG
jgi:hypothetical protein